MATKYNLIHLSKYKFQGFTIITIYFKFKNHNICITYYTWTDGKKILTKWESLSNWPPEIKCDFRTSIPMELLYSAYNDSTISKLVFDLLLKENKDLLCQNI